MKYVKYHSNMLYFMSGIDLLVSRDLSSEFKIKLKNTFLKKLEHELFFEEGMLIKLSIEHFERFHNIFKKYANINLETFEKDRIKKFFMLINLKIIMMLNWLTKSWLKNFLIFMAIPKAGKYSYL